MPERAPGKTSATRLTPEDRRLLAALLAVPVFVFALVYSNVAANHAPKPHAVPIGVTGPQTTVAEVSETFTAVAHVRGQTLAGEL
jgi:hypothetical protein